MALPNCKVCEDSKKMLTDNNIEFELMYLNDKNNLEIAKRLGVKVAGQYLYDETTDSVISVSDYIGSKNA